MTGNELLAGRLREHVCLYASFDGGFVVGGAASLTRILRYSRALLGLDEFPRVSCNAPWVSAVMELDGTLRPCFFQPAYPPVPGGLAVTINGPRAIAFRRSLDVNADETCLRCVCALELPAYRAV